MTGFLRSTCGVFSLLFVLTVSVQANTFIDNKDGTLFDSQASLMWQQKDDGTERVWSEAVKYCEDLELAGHDDWVLPKIFMLEGLIDPGQSPTINPDFSVKPSYYWSASESRTSVKSAKYVNFFYGNTYTYSKDNTYYAICVRDTSADKTSPLVANFNYRKGKEISKVHFTSDITGGSEPFFHEWDFGDGDTSSLKDPVHDFPGDGAYTIMLTVSDNDGSIALSTKQILLPLEEIPHKPTAEKITENKEKAASDTVDIDKTPVSLTDAADVLKGSTSLTDDVISSPEKTAQAVEHVADSQKETVEKVAVVPENQIQLGTEGDIKMDLVAASSIQPGMDSVQKSDMEALAQGDEDLALFDAASSETVDPLEVKALTTLPNDEGNIEENVPLRTEVGKGLHVSSFSVIGSSSAEEEPVRSRQGENIAEMADSQKFDLIDTKLTEKAHPEAPIIPTSSIVTGNEKEGDTAIGEIPKNANVSEQKESVQALETLELADMVAQAVATEAVTEKEVDSLGGTPVVTLETKPGNIPEKQQGFEQIAAPIETQKIGEESAQPSPGMSARSETMVSAIKNTIKEGGQVEKRSILQVFAGNPLTLKSLETVGHRILASAFANAFNGDADLNKDNTVTTAELKGYLSIAMESLSQGSQKPSIIFEGESFAICSNTGQTYAFVVGANIFDQGNGEWTYANESAELVRTSIEKSCQKVKTISLSGEHANRGSVLHALQQVKDLIQPEDSLVFYFSGKNDAGSCGLVLSLADSVSGMTALTGLYYTDILDFVRTMNTSKVTMLLEAETGNK